MAIEFSQNPHTLVRFKYGHHFPGFGHQITTMCWVLWYCLRSDAYPILVDSSDNTYGRWDNYFVPFWNEEKKEQLLSSASNSHIKDVDLNSWSDCRKGLFGMNFRSAENHDGVRNIFHSIFNPNENVKNKITFEIAKQKLPENYASIQIRRGDKLQVFKKYASLSNLTLAKRLNSILEDFNSTTTFVLTDDYRTVKAFQKVSDSMVITRCHPDTTGDQNFLRTKPNNLLELLIEIYTARDSIVHIQTVNSEISQIIRLLRDDANCIHLFQPNQTVYTYL